jgi:MFS family permease
MTTGKISTLTPGAVTLLRHPPFLLFLTGRSLSAMAYQISAVAVGWQIYALTHSAFALGMVGLAAFLPMAGCTFLAGHAADRYARQRVVQLCQLLEAAIATYLAAGSYFAWLTVPEIFLAVACFGAARSFESPSQSALLAAAAPDGLLQKATAIAAGGFQTATIIGPALGGLAYAISPALPYAAMAACWLAAAAISAAIRLDRPVAPKDPPTFRALFAGAAFVRKNPAILGTISLDLFAVLLGGASALFPIYARDILHTGPWGLGLLRGALALGSLSMTIALARHTLTRRAGLRMFQAVIIFGLATIAFSLSRSLPLSLIALVIMGASDTVSVVIRMSLVQLRTPDDMRGRVGAVNFLFINASNQLGEFESGATAALFGAIPAAALGGFGTIAIALLWMRLFPSLRRLERLE